MIAVIHTPEGRMLRGLAFVAAATWLAGVVPTWRNAADLGHAWIAPLLAAYLWWERWDERPALRPPPHVPFVGVALLFVALLAVPVRLLLAPYPLWPMAVITFTGCFALLALVAAGWVAGKPGVRWVGGPLLLALSCVPLPSRIETSAILPLREGMAGLAAEVCNFLGEPALASGTSIQLATGWVGVEEACSGIRSLQACAMMGLFFGEWFRFGIARRLVLVLVGLAAAIAGNFARVLFLSLAAAQEAGMVERSHDLAGWIAMLASLGATGWIAFHWSGYRMPPTHRLARAPVSVRPALAWLRSIALVLILSDVGARIWYARGESERSGVAQWSARFPTTDPSYRPRPLTAAAREILRPDQFRGGGWQVGEATIEAHAIEWTRGQAARSVPFLHNPAVCLPYAGCELVATLPPLDVKWEGGTLPFFVYTFRRGTDEMLVAFTVWDPSRGEPLQPFQARDWASWWRHQWRDVREARQHQPAQLLAISVSGGGAAANRLLQESLEALITPISTY